MEIDLIQHLNDIGLDSNEAELYVALLNSGPTTILLLAKSSGIKRSTVYNTIDSLITRGLAHHEIQGKKKLIAAENPNQLGVIIEKQKQLLNTVLPRLQALHSTTRPSESLIKQFHGLQGIRSVYSNLLTDLKDDEDYLVISNQDKWYDLDPDFFETFIKKRAKLKLNIKLLLQDTLQAQEFKKKQSVYNETIKLLPKHVDININMVITSRKTIIVQLVNPIFALIIENSSMVEMNHMIFNLLWSVF